MHYKKEDITYYVRDPEVGLRDTNSEKYHAYYKKWGVLVEWAQYRNDLKNCLLYTEVYYPEGSEERKKALLDEYSISAMSLQRDIDYKDYHLKKESELKDLAIKTYGEEVVNNVRLQILNSDKCTLFAGADNVKVIDLLDFLKK